METAVWAVLIAALALVVNIFIGVRNGQWGLPDRLSQMEARLMKAVAGNKDALDEEVDKIVSKLDQRDGTIRREFGETVRAMQQKISDLEKYVRDTFVPKKDFFQATADIKDALKERSTTSDKRFDRIEDKIDKLTSHLLNDGDS